MEIFRHDSKYFRFTPRNSLFENIYKELQIEIKIQKDTFFYNNKNYHRYVRTSYKISQLICG